MIKPRGRSRETPRSVCSDTTGNLIMSRMCRSMGLCVLGWSAHLGLRSSRRPFVLLHMRAARASKAAERRAQKPQLLLVRRREKQDQRTRTLSPSSSFHRLFTGRTPVILQFLANDSHTKSGWVVLMIPRSSKNAWNIYMKKTLLNSAARGQLHLFVL